MSTGPHQIWKMIKKVGFTDDVVEFQGNTLKMERMWQKQNMFVLSGDNTQIPVTQTIFTQLACLIEQEKEDHAFFWGLFL